MCRGDDPGVQRVEHEVRIAGDVGVALASDRRRAECRAARPPPRPPRGPARRPGSCELRAPSRSGAQPADLELGAALDEHVGAVQRDDLARARVDEVRVLGGLGDRGDRDAIAAESAGDGAVFGSRGHHLEQQRRRAASSARSARTGRASLSLMSSASFRTCARHARRAGTRSAARASARRRAKSSERSKLYCSRSFEYSVGNQVRTGDRRHRAPSAGSAGSAALRSRRVHPIDAQPDDVAGPEAPARPGDSRPNPRRNRGGSEPSAEASRRRTPTTHQLTLELDEREAPESIRRLPLPEGVDAVDAGCCPPGRCRSAPGPPKPRAAGSECR